MTYVRQTLMVGSSIMAVSGPAEPAEQDAKREVFDGLNQVKRETLSRIMRGTRFSSPVVASFPMQSLELREAAGSDAASGNH